MIGKIFKAIFSNGGAVKSIENIASEWIETSQEKAEASALMVKTLDPNGLMRRDLSNRIVGMYSLYIVTMLLLLIAEAFGFGPTNGEQLAVSVATDKITELFLPISGMTGAIVSASFGVNYVNSKQGT